MALIDDDRVVQAIPPDRSDQSLNVGVLPWRTRCRWSIPNPHGVHPSRLAADPDAELVRVIVTAIALVDVDAARLDAEEPCHVSEDRAERVAVEGIAVQRLGMQHELAALGLRRRRE